MTSTPAPATLDQNFADAVAFHGLEESDRTLFQATSEANQHLLESPRGLEQIADMTRFFRDRDEAGAPSPAPAPGGSHGSDAEAEALKLEVLRYADKHDVPWFTALSKVSGVAEYAEADPRPKAYDQAETPKQLEDSRARDLMREEAVSYFDGGEVARLEQELEQAVSDTGESEIPWLDTGPLARPPCPWSEDDWQRDSRRAAAAGVDMERVQWEAAAEQGRDFVSAHAEDARRQRVDGLEAHREGTLRRAKSEEAERRRDAIAAELDRRAKSRLKGRGLAR